MKPTLFILAAGMGSRYGGLKQIDSVDEQGHIIIDYSIYDAIRAGFRDVAFIIKNGKITAAGSSHAVTVNTVHDIDNLIFRMNKLITVTHLHLLRNITQVF